MAIIGNIALPCCKTKNTIVKLPLWVIGVCPVNATQRWLDLITHCHRVTDRYICNENVHREVFMNNSDRSSKPMSHFMSNPSHHPQRSYYASFLLTAGIGTTGPSHVQTRTVTFFSIIHFQMSSIGKLHTCADHGTVVRLSQAGMQCSLRRTPIQGFF